LKWRDILLPLTEIRYSCMVAASEWCHTSDPCINFPRGSSKLFISAALVHVLQPWPEQFEPRVRTFTSSHLSRHRPVCRTMKQGRKNQTFCETYSLSRKTILSLTKKEKVRRECDRKNETKNTVIHRKTMCKREEEGQLLHLLTMMLFNDNCMSESHAVELFYQFWSSGLWCLVILYVCVY
jgi:hypothetical protein